MKIKHIFSAILFCLIYSITACTSSNNGGNGSKKDDIAKFTVSKFNNNAMIKGESVSATVSVTNGTVITTPIHINITSSDDKKIKLDNKSISCELKTTKDTCIISAAGQDLGSANIIFKSDAMSYTSELLSVTPPNVLSFSEFNHVYIGSKGQDFSISLPQGAKLDKEVTLALTSDMLSIQLKDHPGQNSCILSATANKCEFTANVIGTVPGKTSIQVKSSDNNRVLDTTKENINVSLFNTQFLVDTISSCIVNNKQVYCWGNNQNGSLGNGVRIDETILLPTGPIANIAADKILLSQGVAVATDGDNLYMWGGAPLQTPEQYNAKEDTSNEDLKPINTSAKFKIDGGIVDFDFSIVPGFGTTCIIKKIDNKVYCWGDNRVGQTGIDVNVGHEDYPTHNYDAFYQRTIHQINNNNQFYKLSNSSGSHIAPNFCAITKDQNNLYCWGNNDNNLISADVAPTCKDSPLVGKTYCAPTQVNIPGSGNITEIEVGYSHICAIRNEDLYCWGSNKNGAIGVGSSEDIIKTPTLVSGIKFASVTIESHSTCGVSTEGKLYCWGLYGANKLISNKPVLIDSIPGNPKIAFADIYVYNGDLVGPSIAVITDQGENYVWGDNVYGKLGNGKEDPKIITTPTKVFN